MTEARPSPEVVVRLVLLGLREREAELRKVRTLLDLSHRGEGGVSVVEGPAGIGKTRLLEVACEEALVRCCVALTARGNDLERQFPYGVVRQIFEPVVADPANRSVLEGVAAYAQPVFDSTRFSSEPAEPPDRSEAVLHGLFWLTRNLARREPLLIAVDDAHWADSASLTFLHFLARRLEELPLVLVVSTRPGQVGIEADLVRRVAAEAPENLLELRPLSARATAELVRSRFAEKAADELCEACYRATGGNPFLVHQLADALLAEGVIPDADAGASVSRLVPHAVARHVLVRLSRLGPETISVAHALAVLGPGAELRLVAALAGLGEADTAAAVDALVSADILAPDRPLDFKHPLLREAVYADARPGERLLAHARAARMLAETGSPPERVALQLLVCEPAGLEWTVATLRAAALEATSRGAPQAAVRYLERALDEPPRSDQRGVLLDLGIAESRAAQPRAVDHLAQALRYTDEPIERARIAQELAALLNLLGQFDQAMVVLEEAIAPLGAGDDELRFSLEAEIAVLAVTTLTAKERLASRMAGLREKAASVVKVPAAAPLLAVIALDLAETDAPAGQAIGYARQAFADGRLLSREGAVPAVGTAALVIADQPAEADAILTGAVSAARSRGSIQATRIALVNRAYARNRQGRIAEAEADARLALELSDAEVPDPVRPFKVAQLAEALIERGEIGEANSLLSAAELGKHDPGSKLSQPLTDVHARLLFARARARETCGLLDDALRRQRAWGLRNPGWTSTRSLAAIAHHGVDDVEQARALAAEDLAAASAFGAARPLGIALRTRALVGPGAGIEDLRESAAVLEGSEARLELAKTLVELGSALRRTGSRSAAREPLQRALELSEVCGGAVVAERARTELLASGARPRRPTDGELTPSELRVAAMARDGLSNREIARGLYVSPKTVEMHLSHAYSKLGIRSRTQLAGALEPVKVQGAGTGSSL